MVRLCAKMALFLLIATYVTAAVAADAIKYRGMVKGFNEEKSAVIIFPDDAKEKGLPRRIEIKLEEKDFDRAKNAFITNNNNNPPKGTKVIADCNTVDGSPVATKLVIIPIGC